MLAAQLVGFGGPENLVLTDVPDPEPGPGDVLIAVAAAAVNNTDINTRTGWYGSGGWSGAVTLPRIQGADVCGRITAVGPGVPAERIGERVIVGPVLRTVHGTRMQPPWYLGSECDGGFAELVRVPATNAHTVHRPLSDLEWASFPCSYSTAENLLTRANVGTGDDLLVTGASGGVGSAVIQLALARGAQVTAVSSPGKAAAVQALGVDSVLDRTDDPGQDRFDVVVDLVGGERWPMLLQALRPRGRLATSGAVAGAEVSLDLRTLYLKDLSLFGGTIIDEGVFTALVRRIEDGDIAPLVARSYPLTQIHQAQADFTARAHVGKIVLSVSAA